MRLSELVAFIASKHKPELSHKPGMVWQIWEDGELTLQKSGELLWQRSLHCIKGGLINSSHLKGKMPVNEKEHGYAFIESEAVGEEIRAKMVEFVKQLV